MAIREWAENIICKVDKKYVELIKEHGNKYPLSGYAVFYGPVRERPTILFVGINPGGREKDFVGKKKMLETIKDDNQPMEYMDSVNNYPMAYWTYRIFYKAGLVKELKDSVKTNLFFFRSENMTAMSQMPGYNELKLFCHGTFREIVERIKPKVILAEGVKLGPNDTFNRIIDTLDLKNYIDINALEKRIAKRRNGRRMVYKSYFLKDNPYNIKRIIGIMHLSRPPSSNEEKIITDSLKYYINTFLHRT